MSVIGWKKLDKRTRWLVQAILIIFAFFTISGSRRSYYILPILPLCMLLMSVFLVKAGREIVRDHRERSLKIQKLALIAVAIAEMIIGPLVILIIENKLNWNLPDYLGLSFFVIGLTALVTGIVVPGMIGKILKDRQMQSIWTMIITAGVLMGGFFTWQYNILESRRTERPFTNKLNTVAGLLPKKRVAFWRKYEETMLFYMKWEPPITWLKDENSLQEFLKSDQPGIIISQGRYVTDTIAPMLPVQPILEETCFPWESVDKQQKKMKAWLINQDVSSIAMEDKENNNAK
jgi:4-amino-4-deoxy-L-arabinose transferase-like glycosyltransferase